jgi:hypothetical protein
MRVHSFSGGEALAQKLAELIKKAGEENTVRIGFLDGAKHVGSDLNVATIAAIQEFGAPGASIPARPFFRNMVSEKSPNWAKNLGEVARMNGYDSKLTLAKMGEGIANQLIQSIKDTNDPALSPVTLMLRKMVGNNPQEITGAMVGEAARRVASGESGATGTQAKPLNWTGQMQNSIGYQVSDGGYVHVPAKGK